MERRRKVRFAIHKIVILFGKRLSYNIASAEFQAAQETRILEKQNISTVANCYAGRKVALVIALKRDHRNAESQKIVFAEPSKEEPPIQSKFQIIPGE